MKDLIGALIATAFVIIFAILFFSGIDTHAKTVDQKCKSFYGQEYVFVNGGYGPNLCVTKDGTTKYFNLIDK